MNLRDLVYKGFNRHNCTRPIKQKNIQLHEYYSNISIFGHLGQDIFLGTS